MSSILEDLEESDRETVLEYLDLLLDENKKINLTSIRSRDDALILHIEDSLTALKYFDRAPEGMYADIGSGGGVPGIPLAITSKKTTLLVDSSKKKMKAVNEIISKLNMEASISTSSMRIEDLALKRQNDFSIITARALSSLPSLLELASPLLKFDGLFIAMKSLPDERELNAGKSVASLVGMKEISHEEIMLNNEYTRTLIIYKKMSKSTIELPRRIGLAQHQPLA